MMDKRYESKEQHIAELTIENRRLANRAKAMEKLITGWNEANALLVAKLKPKLSLKDYEKSINYQPNGSFKFIW
jgi:hypothetical protein